MVNDILGCIVGVNKITLYIHTYIYSNKDKLLVCVSMYVGM